MKNTSFDSFKVPNVFPNVRIVVFNTIKRISKCIKSPCDATATTTLKYDSMTASLKYLRKYMLKGQHTVSESIGLIKSKVMYGTQNFSKYDDYNEYNVI